MAVIAKARNATSMERKAWGRVFNDGLWDLYVALLFMNACVWMISVQLDRANGLSAAVAVGFLVIILGGFRLAKRTVTEPRIGSFRIESRRTRKVSLGAYIGVGVTVILVGVTATAATGAFPEGVPLAAILFGVLALQAVVMFALAAHFLGVQRFYVYGLLVAVGYVGTEILAVVQGISLGWDIVAMFGLPALVMLPFGLVLLVRFVRDHPMLTDGD